MNLLIVSAGGRACGKTWALARLAAILPHAVMIDMHPRFANEDGGLYRAEQHLTNPFLFNVDGAVSLTDAGRERLQNAKVVLLATDALTAHQKVAILREALDVDVIWATSIPSKVGGKEIGEIMGAIG